MSNTDLRDTARWAASTTLQLGQLLPDEYDLSWILGNSNSRRYYEKRLGTTVVDLLRDLSNFHLDGSSIPGVLEGIATAGQLVDRIVARLEQHATLEASRRAELLPFDESQVDDTLGAI
jgi:hypothetical protein